MRRSQNPHSHARLCSAARYRSPAAAPSGGMTRCRQQGAGVLPELGQGRESADYSSTFTLHSLHASRGRESNKCSIQVGSVCAPQGQPAGLARVSAPSSHLSTPPSVLLETAAMARPSGHARSVDVTLGRGEARATHSAIRLRLSAALPAVPRGRRIRSDRWWLEDWHLEESELGWTQILQSRRKRPSMLCRRQSRTRQLSHGAPATQTSSG